MNSPSTRMEIGMHLLSFVGRIVGDIVTPALDRRFRISAVTLFCTDDNAHETSHVADVVRRSRLPTNIETIGPNWDVDAVRERIRQFIARASPRCLINLSAATPLQAAVAQQIAFAHNVPTFVIHPDEDTLIWLTTPPTEHPKQNTNVAETLTLESYFALFGYKLADRKYSIGGRDSAREKLAGQLVQIASRLPQSIRALNAAGANLDPDHVSRQSIGSEHAILRRLLFDSGIAEVLADGRIDFRDNETRFFLCGGWLEVWLLAQAAALAGEFPVQDAASGVRIVSHEGVANEYDLAMLINNHLYLVECKTVLPKNQKGLGMDLLFKLDSVSRLGGLQAQAMLVTLGIPSYAEQNRAELQELELIDGRELLQIRERLHDWIQATS